jgi:hypothetical protein
MSRRSTLQAAITRIGANLTAIDAIVGTIVPAGPHTPDQQYLIRQLGKYLKPIDIAVPARLVRAQTDIEKLRVFFTAGTMAERLSNWYDGTGNEPARTGAAMHRLKLRMAFGWSPIPGGPGDQIVMQKKAWILPQKIFDGVMVHESTHFVLATVDHEYDSHRPGHAKLQGLDHDTRYANADNWRIFYQKMSAYLHREVAAADAA